MSSLAKTKTTAGPTLPSPGRRKWKRPNFGLLILALPALIHLIMFTYVPYFGLIIPFKQINFALGIFGSPWVHPWYKNFEFFFKSGNAWLITRNTVYHNLVFITLGTVVPVTLALCLYELKATSVKIFQTCLFIPYFVSWIVASYITQALLSSELGLLPHLLDRLGIAHPMYFNHPQSWYIIFPLCSLWKGMGYSTLLYYAVLMGMDSAYFEAAAIDGANNWQRIRYICIPYLSNTIIMLTILSIGKIFYTDSALFYFVPGANSGMLFSVTQTIDTYVLRALKTTSNMAMTASICLYQSVVGFILVLGTNLIVRKINDDYALF